MSSVTALNFSLKRKPAGGSEDFAGQQRTLAHFNHERVVPGVGEVPGPSAIVYRHEMEALEQRVIEEARRTIAPLLRDVPDTADSFIAWFENLKVQGPGQGDSLFSWLADSATLEQMRWFLAQEVAGEAGFEDLVAMAQVKMPVRPKLEMARNYWDEMGRGQAKGMHGPMLDELSHFLDLQPAIEETVPESLALGNMMMAMAFNRHFAFHAVGALGVIEMTAPGRAAQVVMGLDRLGLPKKESHYFALHSVLDVKHSEAWNREVLYPLVAEDPRRARALAEGAVLRLWCGSKCFERYRRHLLGAQPVEMGRH